MSTTNWMEKTIVPKSDQLNAEDLLTGPMTVTVTGVREGNAEQSMVIEISGPRKLQPYKPCKTMRRVLIMIWGKENEGADWIGRKLTLFRDPAAKWGGEEVGGIRISHMSGIDKPVTLKLTETRGKRATITIQPLKDQPAKQDSKVIQKWRPQFSKAPDAVKSIAEKIRIALVEKSAGFTAEIDAEVQAITDDNWRIKLTDFASDVAAEIDAGASS